jgi:hypothetical protein
MVNFPDMKGVQEPRQKRMSLTEYIDFCEFCIKNNPRITSQSCMDRKTGEEEIKTAFRF